MKYLIYIYCSLLVLLAGCNYLDIVPENDIETIDTIFENREEVTDWFLTCYAHITDQLTSVQNSPAFLGVDELISGEFMRTGVPTFSGEGWSGLDIGDGLQMALDPKGNIWENNGLYAAIRYCNIFVEKVDGVYNMSDGEKRLWKAEIMALKAHIYLELLKTYGPFVLVPENIASNVELETMRTARKPLDECVKAIVDLCDEAIKNLPSKNMKDSYRIPFHNSISAATIKAHALLWAASPIFNGNPNYTGMKNKDGELLFPQEYDHNKWKVAAEAIDEAIEMAVADGISLYDDATRKATQLLTDMSNIENSVMTTEMTNQEAIYMVRVSNKSKRMTSYVLPLLSSGDSEVYIGSAIGCLGPSLNMVELYYTSNGLPISSDETWSYTSRYQLDKETNTQYDKVVPINEDVLSLHLRREPRFYAHIAAHGLYWQQGKETKHNYLVEARQGERFGSILSSLNRNQILGGYFLKKGLSSERTFPDYNNYANYDEPVIVFRLAELYLMQAEAWNEYSGNEVATREDKIYPALNIIRKRAGIYDVVTSWSVYSNDKTKVERQDGLRDIIRDEYNIELAFEGKRYYNLRRWLIAEQVLNDALMGWDIFEETTEGYYNDFNGPIKVWTKRQFDAPRDYLFPIRAEEIMVSGYTQNLGW